MLPHYIYNIKYTLITLVGIRPRYPVSDQDIGGYPATKPEEAEGLNDDGANLWRRAVSTQETSRIHP